MYFAEEQGEIKLFDCDQFPDIPSPLTAPAAPSRNSHTLHTSQNNPAGSVAER